MNAYETTLGKGAWDADANREIPPDKEAAVFEETPTDEHPFYQPNGFGLPTVPPRKDTEHLGFHCQGCRFRVRASVDETAAVIKKRLWDGGLGRGGEMKTTHHGRKRRIIASHEDVVLLYAGERLPDDEPLSASEVPPGCKSLVAIERRLLEQGHPDPEDAYYD